jgi:phosphate starvation-inducible protein PhoH
MERYGLAYYTYTDYRGCSTNTQKKRKRVRLEKFKKDVMAARKNRTLEKVNLVLQEIEPLTQNQLIAFESEKNLVLHGVAGTGKTYISLYLALDDMTKGKYQQTVLIRSAVSTRDMGFLPGTEKEKAAVYEEPYKDICIELFQRGDAYELLKKQGLVHFMTTSFLRGVTLKNSVIIIDECQNMSFHELDSIITRIGQGCRVIFCGDFKQTDFTEKSREKSGLPAFLRILKAMNAFDMIDFTVKDIVRSAFVKQYIMVKEDLGL